MPARIHQSLLNDELYIYKAQSDRKVTRFVFENINRVLVTCYKIAMFSIVYIRKIDLLR